MKIPLRINSIPRSWLLAAGIILSPSLAEAHPGHGPTTGFGAGIAHPLTGLDHICAMLAVGLYAAQRGGRVRWLVPLTFVSFMCAGGLLGMSGMQIGFIEQGIAASVLVLGLLIALAVRLPLAASMGIVALFALFHGYAHGAKMPADSSGANYAAGFLMATMLLHLAGLGFGMAMRQRASERALRYLGGAITVCGLYLCFA